MFFNPTISCILTLATSTMNCIQKYVERYSSVMKWGKNLHPTNGEGRVGNKVLIRVNNRTGCCDCNENARKSKYYYLSRR